MRFQSTQRLVMRGHIVTDVRKFIYTDANVGDLDARELASRPKAFETHHLRREFNVFF